jgi:UDP-N-acetylmuramyl pentapeptide phosphotransferase/UDP-N-acetylglucosamine-1-phosphate transferase
MIELEHQGPLSIVGALVIIVALAASAALITVLKPLMQRYALARPNARSSHREPTPQGGGIAVCAATIGVVAAAALLTRRWDTGLLAELAPLFGAAVLIAAVGALDDIRPIPVAPRFVLQLVAVAVVIATLPDELRVVPMLPFGIERILLVVGGIWFVNLVNFMDGIDWITVAEIVPVTAGLVLIGAFGGLPPGGILVALALLGAMLGFAPFNRPVARLFLGDVGSLPIGLAVGWLLVRLAGEGHLAAAVLLPLYYLADATLTLLRRLINGERVWQAHRTHYYQQATDRGFTVIQIVGRLFAVNLGLVALAVISVLAPSFTVSAGTLATGCALVAWLLAKFARGPGL